MLVRVYNTNYTATFENKLVLNENLYNENLYNENLYPIEISCYVVNNKLTLGYINYYLKNYYLQPIKILGTFNYIKSIYNNTISLLYPITIKTPKVSIILSPYQCTVKEYYGMIRFRYNFGIESIFYDNLNNIDVTRYILRDDELIYIEKGPNIEYFKETQQNDLQLNSKYDSIYFRMMNFMNKLYFLINNVKF
jgi:hypothetical protein